jgi:hypothetical protein
MSDAILILKWLYVPGTPPPSCADALDVDDSGIQSMADAVYLLQWLYVPGSPIPPSPCCAFPDSCGPDPTADTLGCNNHPCQGSKSARGKPETEGKLIFGDATTRDQAVEVSVYAQTLRPLSGIAFTAIFDREVLTFVSVETMNLSTHDADFCSANPDPTSGSVTVGILIDMELERTLPEGYSEIARLLFERKDSKLDTETVLTLTDVEFVDPEATRLLALTNTCTVGAAGRRPAIHFLESYPNPMRDQTQIRFGVIAASEVVLEVYSTTGQLVRTLVEEQLPAGFYIASWDGFDERGARTSNGIYFYRLRAGETLMTRKLVVMR